MWINFNNSFTLSLYLKRYLTNIFIALKFISLSVYLSVFYLRSYYPCYWHDGVTVGAFSLVIPVQLFTCIIVVILFVLC